jgi:hypothetical protein
MCAIYGVILYAYRSFVLGLKQPFYSVYNAPEIMVTNATADAV